MTGHAQKRSVTGAAKVKEIDLALSQDTSCPNLCTLKMHRGVKPQLRHLGNVWGASKHPGSNSGGAGIENQALAGQEIQTCRGYENTHDHNHQQSYYYRRCNRLIERSDGKGAHVRYEGKACILPKCHELQHEGQHKHKGAILQFPAFSVLSK
jgi:hypothetical protein